MPSDSVTRIGIAVVESNGKFLIGVRSPDGPLPGFHEFPGGKLHPGETPEACAVRECLEETGLDVRFADVVLPGDTLRTSVWREGDGLRLQTVDLDRGGATVLSHATATVAG